MLGAPSEFTVLLRLLTQPEALAFLAAEGGTLTAEQAAAILGVTRHWALTLWRHPVQPDGILYRACNDPAQLAVVLFDRVGDVLRSTCEEHNILWDARQLAAILDHYAVGIDPD